MNVTDCPTLADVYAARARIGGRAIRSPLIRSQALGRLTGAEVFLKLETLQPTGSFKVRGAANKILSLSREERSRGVIAFSTGNHGRAVASVARAENLPAVVCLSERVPGYRLEAMRELGAEVVAFGQSQDEAFQRALEIQGERGLAMVAPFDDPLVIAGQGTMALEIVESLPGLASLIVPLSGGGLFSGVALAAKAVNPRIEMVGVSMAVAPAMARSLEAGRPVEIPERDSLADALLGGIGLENRFTFRLTQKYLDRIVLVSEEEIAAAMAHAFASERLVVEGSGAVGIAALLAGKARPKGPAALILSGGNVDPGLLHSLVGQAMKKDPVA
ncbi:MAG: hydroxyectoine utilization dehydratase EutB [Deltaproteobacteria bacterium]|jgi:threonine dehydratase|nr:hydroxyectoine utilization dehydratase EutB [Deltaproteobacteria bacterium]